MVTAIDRSLPVADAGEGWEGELPVVLHGDIRRGSYANTDWIFKRDAVMTRVGN